MATSVEMMRLSEFELDVMAHFWRDGRLSAPELHERIGAERDVAYSTVKTIIDRLEEKGAVKRVASRGRTIYYAPAVPQERVRKPMVRSFVRRLFGNDLKPLFTQLLQDEELSDDEVDYLRTLLERRKKKK